MIGMTVQTSYMRPEDDPANWFTYEGPEPVLGPAVITALSFGDWTLWVGPEKGLPFSASQLSFQRLFIREGMRLVGQKGLLASGYRVPRT